MRLLSRLASALYRFLQLRSSRLVFPPLGAILLLAQSAPNEAAFAADISWASTPPLRVVIHKARQVLAVYEGARLIKTYRVSLGLEPVGPKTETGDRRTPEGEYFICSKSASSSFHRFLGISYPGELDAMRAFEDGQISLETRNAIIRSAKEGRTPPWNTKLGGWVGIHGYPTEGNQKRWVSLLYPKPHNWTNGCIALWDSEIEELYEILPVGTPVTILP
ncbi:MAG: L,D-transpeptidase [Desulfomonile sp.]|nr:L,D-transpeptidase [Desulfomonile sp.]